MSDLEIDFEELLNITVVDGFGVKWQNKVHAIKVDFGFGEWSEVIHMFNQWATDRAAGLHA